MCKVVGVTDKVRQTFLYSNASNLGVSVSVLVWCIDTPRCKQ